MPKMLKKPKKK